MSDSPVGLEDGFAHSFQDTRKAALSKWDGHMKAGSGSTTYTANNTKLHVLMPANNGDVNLCKTLLTGNALGYPDPIILAWGEEHTVGELYVLGC